jgi:Family of unknown function (DUF6364)
LNIRMMASRFIRRMTTKLTLSVENSVIKNAKLYARRHNRSLSEIVSSYLRSLADGGGSEALDPDVVAIADEIPAGKIPEFADTRYRYLKEKYLHG